ncbi:MAG: hypothetical protein NZ839_00555 [Endomicrobia bacterium]|nr:hypothetical protein [Endomicrobiia bacterium]
MFPNIDLATLFNELINDPITRELIESTYSNYSANPLSDPVIVARLMDLLNNAKNYVKFKLRKYTDDNVINDTDLIDLIEYLIKLRYFTTLCAWVGNQVKKDFFEKEFYNVLNTLINELNIKFVDVRKLT